MPRAQSKHAASAVLPVSPLNLPSLHEMQTACITPVWYVPVGQLGQLVPPKLGWYVPLVVQLVHTDCPVLAAKVPG